VLYPLVTHRFHQSLIELLKDINRVLQDRQRLHQPSSSLKPRILVLQASPDSAPQYVPTMNCIFSAQKKSVAVDACVLAEADSSLLQQAAQMTNGVYVKPLHQQFLVQYLLSLFLADPFARKYLAMPQLAVVDHRASCFCHKRMIDIGFVCNVCLSIFCEFSPVCSTCGTKFPLNFVRRPNRKTKK